MDFLGRWFFVPLLNVISVSLSLPSITLLFNWSIEGAWLSLAS